LRFCNPHFLFKKANYNYSSANYKSLTAFINWALINFTIIINIALQKPSNNFERVFQFELNLNILKMTVTYMMLAFTTIYLAGTYFYYRHTVKKGTEFRYKPIFLLIIGLLFLLSLYGSVTNQPFNTIVPFIR